MPPMNPLLQKMLIGGGIGAIGGAVAGGKGHRMEGALTGGAVGGLGGAAAHEMPFPSAGYYHPDGSLVTYHQGKPMPQGWSHPAPAPAHAPAPAPTPAHGVSGPDTTPTQYVNRPPSVKADRGVRPSVDAYRDGLRSGHEAHGPDLAQWMRQPALRDHSGPSVPVGGGRGSLPQLQPHRGGQARLDEMFHPDTGGFKSKKSLQDHYDREMSRQREMLMQDDPVLGTAFHQNELRNLHAEQQAMMADPRYQKLSAYRTAGKIAALRHFGL